MTTRGWWCLLVAGLMLLVGVLMTLSSLVVTGLAIVLWIGWEWLFFSIRLRTLLRRLRVEREVSDDRVAVTTLWTGRDYNVRVALHLDGEGWLPFVLAADCVPFGVQHEDGPTTIDG